MAHDPYSRIDYGAFVVWPQRLAREWALLGEAFAGIPLFRILDLGSGSGEHARLFASHGFEVTGLEASPVLVVQARALTTNPGVSFVTGDISRAGDMTTGPFGAAVCLGNTLPHLREDAELDRLAHDVRRLVSPGGVFVAQILNYDRIFSNSVRYLPPLFRPDAAGETVLLRLLDPQPDKRTVVFTPSTLRYRPAGEPPLEVTACERLILRGWRPVEVDLALERAGFRTRAAYGGFDKRPFDPKESTDLVVLAR